MDADIILTHFIQQVLQFPGWPETSGIELYVHANSAETVALMVDNR